MARFSRSEELGERRKEIVVTEKEAQSLMSEGKKSKNTKQILVSILIVYTVFV